MAVDYLYRSKRVPYNRPLLMDDEKAAIVCRLCLLDPLKWRGLLNRTSEQFATLRRAATANGPQVTLERAPRLIVWPGEDALPVDVDSLEEPISRSALDDLDDTELDDEDVEEEEE